MTSLPKPNAAVNDAEPTQSPPGWELFDGPMPPGWELYEGILPQSASHAEAVVLLREILVAWAARGESLEVMYEMAVRWDPSKPREGIDPDLSVFSPPVRPDDDDLLSVRTYTPGHHPPLLAIEVVSTNHPRKDYDVVPDKYGASGTRELWVFDPHLAGPRDRGGPYRLQIWSRDTGNWKRIYAGPGPTRSPVLGAYAVPVENGKKLRIADDLEGTRLWLTTAEAERAAKEAALAAKEAALAAKEAALAAKEAALAAKETERAAKEAALAAKEAALAAKEAAEARVAELEALLQGRSDK